MVCGVILVPCALVIFVRVVRWKGCLISCFTLPQIFCIQGSVWWSFDGFVDTAACSNGRDQAAVADAVVAMLQFKMVALQI